MRRCPLQRSPSMSRLMRYSWPTMTLRTSFITGATKSPRRTTASHEVEARKPVAMWKGYPARSGPVQGAALRGQTLGERDDAARVRLPDRAQRAVLRGVVPATRLLERGELDDRDAIRGALALEPVDLAAAGDVPAPVLLDRRGHALRVLGVALRVGDLDLRDDECGHHLSSLSPGDVTPSPCPRARERAPAQAARGQRRSRRAARASRPRDAARARP